MSKKINLDAGINRASILAKLLNIQRALPSPCDVSKDEYCERVKSLFEANFEIKYANKERAVLHLTLYTLGNENNIFSKALNN